MKSRSLLVLALSLGLTFGGLSFSVADTASASSLNIAVIKADLNDSSVQVQLVKDDRRGHEEKKNRDDKRGDKKRDDRRGDKKRDDKRGDKKRDDRRGDKK